MSSNSELSFLLDILLEHKLPKKVKELVIERIKEVEAKYINSVFIPAPAKMDLSKLSNQAPSTLANFEKHGDPSNYVEHLPAQPPSSETPAPVQHVAQTPMAAQAMQSRVAAIRNRDTPDPSTGRPRKF